MEATSKPQSFVTGSALVAAAGQATVYLVVGRMQLILSAKEVLCGTFLIPFPKLEETN